MSSPSVLVPEDVCTLQYVATHVFCPLQLPSEDDHNIRNDRSLASAVAFTAHMYNDHIDQANMPMWHSVCRMLDNLLLTMHSASLDRSRATSQLSGMGIGDVVAFLIRAQNAAVLFRKQKDVTIFESFEVSPKAENVMTTRGKLICSYPEPAIEVPNTVFEEDGFLSELANFLAHMNDDILDSVPTSRKAQSTVHETRDTTHPRYITELLAGIMRGVGHPADIVRITKRVGDDVVWNNSKLPWRRSPLWLLIRVAIQTSLDRSTLGRNTYKGFMLSFMCSLANERACTDLSNDMLQCMAAKISRRLRKLGPSVPDWLSRTVLRTCTCVRSTIKERWIQVQDNQRKSPSWNPTQLDLARDIKLSLRCSRKYIRNCLAHGVVDSPSSKFRPTQYSRGTLDDFLSSGGSFFEEAYLMDPHVTLYDVKCAVEQGIDDWVDRVTENDEACVQLEILANQYSTSALGTYTNNPELHSAMLLTMIELWVALDKITIREIPMLADYSPEVPTSLLEELLICKSASLSRLRLAHEYLSRRHSEAHIGWSVFTSPQAITANSFAIRFYKGSSHLKNLMARIERVARREVHEKVTELERANARHAKLKQRISTMDHNFAVNRDGYEYHVKGCDKCCREKELSGMQIAIHEWPLPAEELHAEAVVFELDCPVSFNMWRSTTFHLLVDICSPSIPPRNPYTQLNDVLRYYLISHPRSRITLASDTKPFTVTHYTKVSIPTKLESICVKNGLKFYGFDSHSCLPVSEALGHFNIKRYCTYTLQNGPYKDSNLQKYVNATSHTSNEILASQVDCHKDISIHEFIAFGHLRSGGLLQWLNVLRELRSRSLSFRRPEVYLLLAQAVSQVGPLENGEWKWHQEFQQSTFCDALLEELESLVGDVESNWLESVTMETVSLLLRCLLAYGPYQGISLKALGLLRTVRGKVFSWVNELFTKLTQTPGDEETCGILRDAAAVFRGTFNVDHSLTRHILASEEDVEIFLSSSILIHDYTPSNISSLSEYSKLLLDRDRQFSLEVQGILNGIIQADPSDTGIDRAIGRVWPDYRPGSKWTPLRNPNSCWLSCKTASTANQMSQEVHFNLLDGSLLVNGRPLGRLPREILSHPLYNLIFGERVLDVIPSDLPGMNYSTRGVFSAHYVHFSLRSDSDLVIRAKRKVATGDSDVFELIPQEMFQGDLPAVLIVGHAHWLNLSSSIMEIRPLDTLWEPSLENWRLYSCTPAQYHIKKGDKFLVDIRSKSWDMVSRLLEPLDTPQNLIITASLINSGQPTSSLQLSVSLPRYALSFYIDKDGDLQSSSIRGMVYDENQCIGTLFGLVNRLVLRPKIQDIKFIPRCVLIPDGEISFRKDGHHVWVKIDTHGTALGSIAYQTYRADTILGCLTGNVSLTNKLYCAYLHALTSGCGNDPLTGRSGTEEALSLLGSANCWSVMKLNPREAELLSSIASICPSRTWYPVHMNCMQKVEWLNLPASVQHHELYLVAKAIKEHHEKVQLFYETQPHRLFQRFPSLEDHLLQRSAQRATYLLPSMFSERHCGANLDVRYPARDLVDNAPGEVLAYVAAVAVHSRTANAVTPKNILSMVKSWGKSTMTRDAALSLQYDSSWLDPTLHLVWLKMYELVRRNDNKKWFQLLFSLPAMAYASSKPKLDDLVPALVAFASDLRFRSENPPQYGSYDLADGYAPSFATLHDYVLKCAHPFSDSPESSLPKNLYETATALRQRRGKSYSDRRKADADTEVQRLLDAWPCETLARCSLNPNLYDVPVFMHNANRHFSSCYHNLKLKEHFTRVQNILNDVCSRAPLISTLPYSFQPSQSVTSDISWFITMDHLFTRPAPSLRNCDMLHLYSAGSGNTTISGSAQLHQLIDTVEANSENEFQRRYVASLRSSAEGFGGEVSHETMELPTTKTLVVHYHRCWDTYTEGLAHVKQHLGPRSSSEQALEQSGQWPRITAYILFRFLASNSPVAPPDDWKTCLMQLTRLALELQRSRRLLQLHSGNLCDELRRELQNDSCDGWDAEAHPDWLLIQLQGNFLVRRVQAEVATEMISPRSGSNTAMQLNMGEGKSSVIVPIVVVTLANGTQLVRVIVPKALSSQMFHLLADRLGGLANRRIYFLPFSRSLELDHQSVAVIRDVMLECMKQRGILVVQPEHILSLRLVSVEKQLSQPGEQKLAEALLELQRWLHSRSRDILDESDEILHVRYQLVYTIGLQQHMEGFPNRWSTTEQVLGLVSKHASSLRELFPLGVEYERGSPGSFPHLRILHQDAGKQLMSWIVQDIVDGLLPNFNFGQLTPDLKDIVRSFISCKNLPLAKHQLAEDHAQGTNLWGGLLLLRGLLATGMLLFALRERRWRVDYGLAPMRTMLAVPYRAKDVPAQRAEFGHPDVAIILTCLSYYYGGLSEEQLKVCFALLLKQDDPPLAYDLWIRDHPATPECLQTLNGVNVKSSEQWKNLLFPLFRQNRATVNFYLSNVVFPKEAKEFPSKLSCSGWDLAEKKTRLLTGFSGTNDGQYLSPLHITQHDPDHQRGTNAKVLSYLLQPENKHYMCMTHENGERRTTDEFLEVLVAQKPEIRVLLDVGAQMLDLGNRELAQKWLTINANVSAAIYFNQDDELSVITQDGNTQLLISSPFAQQLDQCVVYLDDAHTRGTDIKFPSGFRAAVTLGPKVTKDRLTQGCMRMRKLGHGHSVMFFASPEIDRRIRSVADKGLLDTIETMDILLWAIRETCNDIQQRVPHWAQQGIDHTSRYAVWMNFCRGQLSSDELSAQWLQPEAKKLEELYGRDKNSNPALLAAPEIRDRCIDLGVLSLRDVSMDEEQEREVIHEAERERQVERPPRVPPATHSIHPDVVSFVKTGIVPTRTQGFHRAFETLDTTSAATTEAQIWSPCILTTTDFQKTVKPSGNVDDYLRPVMWVVSGKRAHHEALVILSPFEVNHLLPRIRKSDKVHLHLYTPRTASAMKPCDDLSLYSIPTVPAGWTPPAPLMDQLNVFSGQLYLKDYETYIRLCRFLCVYTRDLEDEEGIEAGFDGFIPYNRRPKHMQSVYTFQATPLNSVRTLMSLRRKGLGFAPTHTGKLVDGRLLSESDFDGEEMG